jgi:hypothetical protein
MGKFEVLPLQPDPISYLVLIRYQAIPFYSFIDGINGLGLLLQQFSDALLHHFVVGDWGFGWSQVRFVSN